MAMTFHSIEQLGPPFVGVSELGLVIAQEKGLLVRNAEMKLLFFLQADCQQEIEGFGTFAMQTGDICVVPRNCRQLYRLNGAPDSARLHVLKLSLSLPALPAPGQPTKVKVRGNPETDLKAFCRHHFTEIRHLPLAQTAPMQEIMLAIRREAETHRPGIRHRVRALCTNLLVHVARRLHETPDAAKPADAAGHGAVVNQTKEYLIRNFAKPLTLGEIAWHVRLSEEHLARVFRKVTGQTVFDYLRTIRLESAKTLLIDSNQPLTRIAAQTGFGSLSLFSRNFSQYVGVSASAYREQRAQGTRWT